MDGVSCFFTWRQEASCSSMFFCLKNQQGLKEPGSWNITWKHWFGTVLNISYISSKDSVPWFSTRFQYTKKHLKKKLGTLENKTFLSFCVVVTCHKPSVNSHQPSKEDPISQHLTNTTSLQSEADPFSFGWNFIRLYTFCIYHLAGPSHYLHQEISMGREKQKLHPYLAVMLFGLLPQSLGTEVWPSKSCGMNGLPRRVSFEQRKHV